MTKKESLSMKVTTGRHPDSIYLGRPDGGILASRFFYLPKKQGKFPLPHDKSWTSRKPCPRCLFNDHRLAYMRTNGKGRFVCYECLFESFENVEKYHGLAYHEKADLSELQSGRSHFEVHKHRPPRSR